MRAGGYKSNAYPYGGILARKSVAEKEKIAFLKSADQLEESIATAISSGRISSVGGDPTLALTSISSLITNLQNIDPVGRVVTEFDLDLLKKYPERDLFLEPGDRIFIRTDPQLSQFPDKFCLQQVLVLIPQLMSMVIFNLLGDMLKMIREGFL